MVGVNRAGTPWIFSSLQEGQRHPCGPSFTLSGAKAVPPPQLGWPGPALLRHPRFPLPCQPPSPAQRLVLRTNRPSLAGAVARPRKACVSFNTAGPAGARPARHQHHLPKAALAPGLPGTRWRGAAGWTRFYRETRTSAQETEALREWAVLRVLLPLPSAAASSLGLPTRLVGFR